MDGTEELPPGWAWARLGELGAVTGGLTKNPDRSKWPERVPFLRVANVQRGRLDLADVANIGVRPGELPRVLLKSGDLLVVEGNGSLDQIGRCAVWTGDIEGCAHQNHIIKVRFGHNDLSRWVSHWLTSAGGRAAIERVASSTSGLHTLSISKVGQLLVPVAPAAERTRIMSEVEALSEELDEAEAALRRARVALVDYRASLLHAASTGELTAAWRAANPRSAEDGPALLRRILIERRTAWECAELARLAAKGKPVPKGDAWKARYEEPCAPDLTDMPELPPGWVWASLDQLSRDRSYGTSAKSDVAGRGMPVLRIPNVQTGRVDWSNLKLATTDLGLVDADHLTAGDLLVVRTNGSPSLIGRAAVVMDPPNRPSYFASYLIRFRLLGPSQIHHWIGTVFASGLVRLQVRRFAATSAGQYNISQTNLAGFAIPLPPLSELDAIQAELEAAPGIDVGWPTESEVAAFRQSILHAAFNGRLVPQNPADESAAALLARLRAAPAVSGRAPRRARPVQDALL